MRCIDPASSGRAGFSFREDSCYLGFGIAAVEVIEKVAVASAIEESPGFTGQGAGEIPVGVTRRKVPQKANHPLLAGKGERVR